MTPLSPARIAELRAEIEHRRSIACESIGPLPLDEVEALVRAALLVGQIGRFTRGGVSAEDDGDTINSLRRVAKGIIEP